ncbi:trypsin-like peptidase domain-containing protein [Candidatus Woesearchaeota archaeon]|nr:trypsin-like peptidase domain-containing protein [Candidatus Woesearchaeota archaeon]
MVSRRRVMAAVSGVAGLAATNVSARVFSTNEMLDQIIAATPLLFVDNTFIDEEAGTPEERDYHRRSRFIGVIFQDYILTTAHGIVSDIKRSHSVRRGKQSRKVILKDSDRQVYLPYKPEGSDKEKSHLVKQLLLDEKLDFAVLELPRDYAGPRVPVRLGDSDKVKLGQEVWIVGNGGLKGDFIKRGTIANYVQDDRLPFACPVLGGDSGAGVYHAETFELLGLVRSARGTQSYAVPINFFKGHIQSAIHTVR